MTILIASSTGSSASLTRLSGGYQSSSVTTATTTVSTTTTQLCLLTEPGVYRLTVTNTGATALNSFAIQGRNSTDDAWENVVSSGSDFTTIPDRITCFLLRSDDTTSPTTLAGSGVWTGSIDSKTFIQIRLVATVAAGTTTVNVWAG